MDKLNDIKNARAQELMAKKNVVGVVVGKKITDGKTTDEDSIMVLVEKKRDPNELSAQDMVPDYIDGVKTDVIETGLITPMSHRGKHRPVTGGVSAIHYHGTACTLGGIVFRGNRAFALQNAHCGFPHWEGAKKGDPILQPSPLDGGTSADEIGTAYEVQEIKFDGSVNLMDACLVELTTDATYLEQWGNDNKMKPEMKDCVVGEEVVKSGRTTGYQTAKVIGVGAIVQVSYDEKIAVFHNQIITENEGGRFISGGDSSSLVLNRDGNPVGQVFAGSNKIGIFTPIKIVAARFKIAFEPRKTSEKIRGFVALRKFTNKRDFVEIEALSARKGNYGNFDYALNVRDAGGLEGSKIATLPPGTQFEIVGEPFEKNGYLWSEVEVTK